MIQEGHLRVACSFRLRLRPPSSCRNRGPCYNADCKGYGTGKLRAGLLKKASFAHHSLMDFPRNSWMILLTSAVGTGFSKYSVAPSSKAC
jgi:hypothetical protein